MASPAQLVRTGWLTAARADDLIGALETAAPRDRGYRRLPPHRDINEHRRWQDSFAPAAIAADFHRINRFDWGADRPQPVRPEQCRKTFSSKPGRGL